MDLSTKLHFQPYSFSYKKNDIVKLKDTDIIVKLNKIIADNTNIHLETTDYPWMVNEDKINFLSNKLLVVQLPCFWHTGIPFYFLSIKDFSNHKIAVGEFYLEKTQL